MTPPAREEMLITPVMREIWRPFYAFGAIACLIVVVGVAAAMGGASDAMPVVLFSVTACVGSACVRTLVWRLVPARVTVGYDGSGLFVRRGGKLLRHHPWTSTQQVNLMRGDRWPEWSRTAMFPCISVVRHGEGGPHIDLSPGFLLVRPRDLEQAERTLEAVVQRYVAEKRA